MSSEDHLTYYETAFLDLRERLIRVLGCPTVNRLVERSVREIASVHPAIASLRCDEDDVRFEGVRQAAASLSEAEIRDAFVALNGVLLVIVARLLGREIAERLTEGVPVAEALRRGGTA